MRLHLVLITVIALTSCKTDDDGTGIDQLQSPVDCASTNVLSHSGTIASETWTRAKIHLVPDTVYVTGTLEVEPGAMICLAPSATILLGPPAGKIIATGTATMPITFTAATPAAPWLGIRVAGAPGQSRISNALIEYALNGVIGNIRVDSTHFRQIGCTAVLSNTLLHSTVDTAGIAGCPAVIMGDAVDSFVVNTIRGSGGDGLYFTGSGLTTASATHASVVLLNSRFEDTKGDAIEFDIHYNLDNVVAEASPARIVGTGGNIFIGPISAFMKMWPTRADQDSLLGNVHNSVKVWGDLASGDLTVQRDFTWTYEGHPLLPWTTLGPDVTLRLEPGARFSPAKLRLQGQLYANGTAQNPVHITRGLMELIVLNVGLELGVVSPMLFTLLVIMAVVLVCDNTSSCQNRPLSYISLDTASLSVTGQNLSHVTASGSTLTLTTADLTQSELQGAAQGQSFSLVLYNHVRVDRVTVSHGNPIGILIAGDSDVITNCVVSDNGYAGIMVQHSGGQIHNCILENNHWAAVEALSAPVDARGNWWGSPFGAQPGYANQVIGQVDVGNPLVIRPGSLPPTVSCRGIVGTPHLGRIQDETWTRAASPHVVTDTVIVRGTLTIEPGALVCVSAGRSIRADSLTAAINAVGTAAAPILFTALDPTQPWEGITARPTGCSLSACMAPSRIRHAIVEYARNGIYSTFNDFRVDSSQFRQIRCTAYRGPYLAYSTVDTAGIDGCAAVVMGMTATDTFAYNIVRHSGGDGVVFQSNALHTSEISTGNFALLGGRIENSAGIGLLFDSHYIGDVVASAQPLRIVASGKTPFFGPLGVAMHVWPTRSAQDSLLGNGSDTLMVWGNAATGEMGMRKNLNWRETNNLRLLGGLTIGPATTLRVDADATFQDTYLTAQGRIVLEGSIPTLRIASGALTLDCTSALCGARQLSNVRATGGRLTLKEMSVDNVEMSTAALNVTDGSISGLTADSSAIELSGGALTHATIHAGQLYLRTNTRVDSVIVTNAPNSGISAQGKNISISNCSITDTRGGDAIRIFQESVVVIRDCILENSSGFEVNNYYGSADVDALFNWWGSASGPAQDGVHGASANVRYNPWLTVRPTILF